MEKEVTTTKKESKKKKKKNAEKGDKTNEKKIDSQTENKDHNDARLTESLSDNMRTCKAHKGNTGNEFLFLQMNFMHESYLFDLFNTII